MYCICVFVVGRVLFLRRALSHLLKKVFLFSCCLLRNAFNPVLSRVKRRRFYLTTFWPQASYNVQCWILGGLDKSVPPFKID